jgi:hypothetical protein
MTNLNSFHFNPEFGEDDDPNQPWSMGFQRDFSTPDGGCRGTFSMVVSHGGMDMNEALAELSKTDQRAHQVSPRLYTSMYEHR